MKKFITFSMLFLAYQLNLISQIPPSTSILNRNWGTYIGGNSSEGIPGGLVLDSIGNIYISSSTRSNNNFGTPGTHLNSFSNCSSGISTYNAYLMKLDSNGNQLWGTYFGGACYDVEGKTCAVDKFGNVFLAGKTKAPSGGAPISSLGSHQENYGGGTFDGFLAKFDNSGNLLWATYYGGGGRDWISGCDVDSIGNIYITGYTQSSNNISVSSGHQPNNGGSSDVFLAKFNPSGVRLWGTYYGGSGSESPGECKIKNNSIFLAGQTTSSSGISTPGTHQNNLGGSCDGFVVKFNLSGVREWGTYIGGSDCDGINSLSCSSLGDIYLVGFSGSLTGISTLGSYQISKSGGHQYDGFLTKLNSLGIRQWGTYIGGTNEEYIYSCDVDNSNNLYLSGTTNSSNGLINGISFQNNIGGNDDAFIFKFDSNGDFKSNSYYGGSSDDWGDKIAVDKNSNVILFGYTNSSNNISTPSGFLTNYQGGSDHYLVKFKDFYCNSITGTDVQIACDSLTWIDGVTYTSSNNTATHTLTNSVGCDSVVTLDLTINYSTTGTDVITACDSYTWIDGVTYTANNDTATYTIDGNIGSGISFKINSPNLIAGNYNFSTTAGPGQSPAGWTATPDLNDTANAVAATLMFVEDGTAGINPQGNPISQEGCFPLINDLTGKIAVVWRNTCQFGEKILNAEKAGAVGVIIINREPGLTNMAPGDSGALCTIPAVFIENADGVIISNEMANGPVVGFIGALSTAGGNAVGCDSVVTLDLTINYSTTETDVITACDSLIWIDGVTYTSSNNTATYTLTNSAGCDSVVTLDLTINNSSSGTDLITACDSLTWIDGVTYTTSNNTATHTLTNANGCDSVVNLDFTINNSSSGTDVITACDSLTWIDGVTYTASNNIATHTLTNAVGCDSVVTLDLTINYSTTGMDVITACDSLTWIDGVTYIASNNSATHTLTNASGCDSVVTIDLTINTSPTVDLGIDTILCSGTTIDLVAGSGFTYLWSDATTNQTLTASITGEYNVTITDGNGCVDSDTINVTLADPLVVTLDSTNITCNGLFDGTASVTAIGGNGNYTYQWDLFAGDQTTSTATNLAAGTYNVTITDQNVCSFDTTVTVLEPDVISIDNTSQDSVSCNGLFDGTASVTAIGGNGNYSYLWSDGQTNDTATNLGAGLYTVTVTDQKGCFKDTTLTVLEPVELTVASMITDSVSCNGLFDGTASITPIVGSGNYSYLWSDGQTTATAISLTAGTYTVRVTDQKGCFKDTTVTILEPDELVASTIVVEDVLCFGESTGQASASVTGGNGNYIYLWSNGQTTATATNLAVGTYQVTVIDQKGCSDDSSVTIQLDPSTPAGGISSTDTQVACDSLTWIDGVTYTASNNTATHTLTNASGCDSVVSLNLTISSIVTTISQNGNDVEATATNGTAPYSYDWNTGETTASITPAVNGMYWVMVSDADSCFADTATFDVTFVSGTGIDNWNNSVSVYPNPTSDIFTISTGNYTGALKVNVYDLFGRKVFTSNDKEISLKSFADGVYILEFKAADKTYTTRIIKE